MSENPFRLELDEFWQGVANMEEERDRLRSLLAALVEAYEPEHDRPCWGRYHGKGHLPDCPWLAACNEVQSWKEVKSDQI